MDRKGFERADGTRVVYAVAGDGPPVLLLHGITMSSDMWRENGMIDALSSRYRLILPDLAGHGRSDKPHDPASYGRRYLDDIATLCAREAGRAAHLVGFSMGAELALAFAADQPEHVASLFLCGSGWSPPEALDIYAGFADWARSMPPEERPASWDLDALAAVIAAVGETIPAPRDRIEALDIPARGMVGGEDPEKPYLERLTGVLRGFKLEILPGIPHETSWRQPRFSAAVTEFLNEFSAS
jgi:pimeloyl-ACP methyl ester carboxylesterase